MPEIVLLFDRSEPDELGIRLTASEMGIDLGYLPFYKTALGFGESELSYKSLGKNYTSILRESQVVLNRTQSKNRRVFAASILETLGKRVINTYDVENICSSKVRTLLKLFYNGVKIPETVYIPSNVQEPIPQGGVMNNINTISMLIEKRLDSGMIVVKPDGGTHGKGIGLAENKEELKELLERVTPSIINPSGVLAQEYVPKWFYDLRIIVTKQKNSPVNCAPIAMARAGFSDFRTNTYLGNKIFHVELPPSVIKTAREGGEALLEGSDAGVLAFDAMPYFREKFEVNEETIKLAFTGLDDAFGGIQSVKNDPMKKKDFERYSEKLDAAYDVYTSTEEYHIVQKVIQDSLNWAQDSVVLHECNACPEFWEQTREISGINLAEYLLRGALSLLE